MHESTAKLVANRVQCLYACYLRAHAEAIHRRRDPGLDLPAKISAEEQIEICRRALGDPTLTSSWTSDERRLIGTKLGRLQAMEMRAGIYSADSFDVLVQALSGFRGEPPPWSQAAYVTRKSCSPDSILGPRPARWLREPVLAPSSTLRRAARISEAYAWRTRLYALTLTHAFRENAQAE